MSAGDRAGEVARILNLLSGPADPSAPAMSAGRWWAAAGHPLATLGWAEMAAAPAWLALPDRELRALRRLASLLWSQPVIARSCDGRARRLGATIDPTLAARIGALDEPCAPVPSRWDEAELVEIGTAVLRAAVADDHSGRLLDERLGRQSGGAGETARPLTRAIAVTTIACEAIEAACPDVAP